jgi:hypothetical protein
MIPESYYIHRGELVENTLVYTQLLLFRCHSRRHADSVPRFAQDAPAKGTVLSFLFGYVLF